MGCHRKGRTGGSDCIILKEELELDKVATAFRQGVVISLMVCGFLMLQSVRLLTWYNVAFLIIGVSILELFIISRRGPRYE